MTEWQRLSSAMRYALCAAGGALVPSTFLLGELNEQIARAAPGECGTFLDTAPWPTAASIHPHLQCLGAAGRALHLRMYAFDLLLFPLIYCTALVGVITLAWGPRAAPSLRLVAVAAGAFDVLENASNVFLLRRFPRTSAAAALASSIGTRGKWLCLAAALVLVALGAARRLAPMLKRKSA